MKNCIICNTLLQGNQQKFCSGKCKQKAHWHSKKDQTNTYHSQTLRALNRKMTFIEKLGGACSMCGYNKNIAALDFHHLNANDKSFKLDSRKLSNTRLDVLLKELDKCTLLCANCHREHHYPESDLDNVKKILNP